MLASSTDYGLPMIDEPKLKTNTPLSHFFLQAELKALK
jgi:hypothetical protein